ncbi:MAG: CpaF family protein, partial [Rhizobiaceae bacterium]|nr:CpaF family protein [Rhizobiaceae bacterium]
MNPRFSAIRGRGADAVTKVAEAPGSQLPPVVLPSVRPVAPKQEAVGVKSNRVLDARDRIHRMLIEEINLVALERLPRPEMRKQVHDFVSEKIRDERMAINVAELDALVDDIVDEMVGLGPLEPLLKDPDIADILING